MRRSHLVLLLVPGPLLLVGVALLRRPEPKPPVVAVVDRVPVSLKAWLGGLDPIQVEALMPRVQRYAAVEHHLDWCRNALDWLYWERRGVDALHCSGELVPTGAPEGFGWLAEAWASECVPSCGRSWEPVTPCGSTPSRGWPQLDVRPALAARVVPTPPTRGPTARHARHVDRLTRDLQLEQAWLDATLSRPAPLARDILACTADAAGVRLESALATPERRIPGLGPGVPLRSLPFAVIARGPRPAMAAWLARLATGGELWSVARAHVEPLADGPDMVELDAELELFVVR